MIYQAAKGDFAIALTGDSMLTRRLTLFKEERFLALRETLRGADAAFTNLEGTVHTWDEGTPGITQGTFMTTEPKLLDDLKWLGVNLVSCANNHAFDYGEGGVLANIKHLNDAGIAHAGTGQISPRRARRLTWGSYHCTRMARPDSEFVNFRRLDCEEMPVLISCFLCVFS